MEKLITKSFRRLLDKGVHRGFITYEELGKSLGKRHYSRGNIELYLITNRIQTYSEQIADAIMNESSEIIVGEKFEVALKFIREQGIIYDLHQELENNHTIKDCPLCSSRRK